jgi:hypothetical protein
MTSSPDDNIGIAKNGDPTYLSGTMHKWRRRRPSSPVTISDCSRRQDREEASTVSEHDAKGDDLLSWRWAWRHDDREQTYVEVPWESLKKLWSAFRCVRHEEEARDHGEKCLWSICELGKRISERWLTSKRPKTRRKNASIVQDLSLAAVLKFVWYSDLNICGPFWSTCDVLWYM